MSESGEGECALALSIFSAARGIEALLDRINAKLYKGEALVEPCSCHLSEEASP
jgi:hypothetical protein